MSAARCEDMDRGAIHLFLLSPPLSGSTLVQQIVATSPNVTTFELEGQWLPGLEEILGRSDRWDPGLQVDWSMVRKVFQAHWSPLKPIRFEKSPPHLVRAGQLAQEFSNSRFLISIRNPYAQIEGVLRRKWLPSPEVAAEFWVNTASAQIRNRSTIKPSLFFSYEELTDHPERFVNDLQAFLPEIESIATDVMFTAHNVTGKPMQGVTNLNDCKIRNLTGAEIAAINSVLKQHGDVLDYFGYSLI